MSLEGPESSKDQKPENDEFEFSNEFGDFPCHTLDEAREDLAPQLESICRLKGFARNLTMDEAPIAFRCDRTVLPLFGSRDRDRRFLEPITLDGHAVDTYDERSLYLFLSEVRTFLGGRAAIPIEVTHPNPQVWSFPKMELFETPAALFGEIPLSEEGSCLLKPALSKSAIEEAYEHARSIQDEVTRIRLNRNRGWVNQFNHGSLLVAVLVNEVEDRHLKKDKGLEVVGADNLKNRVASQPPGIILGLSHLAIRHDSNEVGIVTLMPGEEIQSISKGEVRALQALNNFPLLEKIYSVRIDSEGMLLEGAIAKKVELRPLKAA